MRLGDVLGSAGRELGLEDARATAIVLRRWQELVGEDIAGHAEPTSLRSGVLRVRAVSPVWATELGYLTGEIKDKVNALLGAGSVQSVKVWTAPGAPSPNPAGSRAKRAERPSLPEDEAAAMEPGTALARARAAWAARRSGRGSSRDPENR